MPRKPTTGGSSTARPNVTKLATERGQKVLGQAVSLEAHATLERVQAFLSRNGGNWNKGLAVEALCQWAEAGEFPEEFLRFSKKSY